MKYAGLASILFASCCATAAQPRYECLIEPMQTVALRSTVAGVIESIQAHRGARVYKDEVLVTLESSAESAALDLARYKASMSGAIAEAQAKYEYAQRKYERLKAMRDQKLVSAQKMEEAEGDMKTAQAQVQVAQENQEQARLEYAEQQALFERRTLRSPLDGVVADQLQDVGEVVEPSDPSKPILKLEQIDPLRVHVVLPRTAFGQIRPGMVATVYPEAPIGRKLYGRVTMVDAVVDGASGTFAAYIELRNDKHRIPSGIRCTAAFDDLPKAASR